jgi:UDP-N-acetylmuramoylalanine--D-glutamate ligase
MIKELKEKKVLILGYGKEGKDTLKYLRSKFPNKKIGVADFKEKEIEDTKVKSYFGSNYLDSVEKYEIIIKSPGVPLKNLEKYKNIKITCQADIFLKEKKGKVIGVTGTKGKSSTCLIIYNILKEKGFPVYLLGNIGEPVLNYLDKEGVFIYELSSFQLQTVTTSPEIAIILNIFKDHLDQHKDFNSYLEAKKNILKFQGKNDKLIYNKEDSNVLKLVKNSEAEKIAFNPKERLLGSATYLDPILKIIDLFGIKREEALQIISKTDKLPHRLEFIGKRKGIKFYNDSASTIPEAAVEAIKNISDLDTIIVGGVDKGGDYGLLADKISNSKIRNVILFPKSGKKIKSGLKNNELTIKDASSMEEAVRFAYQLTEKNKSCLLSPASSSFNMFNDYKDRGDQFRNYVNKDV